MPAWAQQLAAASRRSRFPSSAALLATIVGAVTPASHALAQLEAAGGGRAAAAGPTGAAVAAGRAPRAWGETSVV
jgi:hypothetical protein